MTDIISKCVQLLEPQDKRIIDLYYYQNLNQTQIGEKLGISQRHAGRMIKHAVYRLRKLVIKEVNSAKFPFLDDPVANYYLSKEPEEE